MEINPYVNTDFGKNVTQDQIFTTLPFTTMYNFENQSVPLQLPVSETTLLQPWFEMSQLEKGLELIREKKIIDFHCIRNTTGAIVEEEFSVTLQFTEKPELLQGFAITKNHCSYCRLYRSDKRCHHMAALAILSLSPPAEQKKTTPISIGFSNSHWFQTGTFLYEWLNRTKFTIGQATMKRHACMEITSSDGGILKVDLPENWAHQGEQFLARKTKVPVNSKNGKPFHLLREELYDITITQTERKLQKAGSNSIAWKKEISFWFWLTRLLFLRHGNTLPDLTRDPATSHFVLELGSSKNSDKFSLTLPPGKTWAIIQVLYKNCPQVKILPPAKECYNVFFADDNQLEVVPSLLLEDGRVLSRRDLAPNKLQGAYYLENEGFLPVRQIPAEGKITNPQTQEESLPLFGFINKEKIKDDPFSIPPNDLSDFIETNSKPLHFPDNIIDPKLLELQIKELPDQLVIDSYSEDNGWCYLSCYYGLGNTRISLKDIASAKKQKLRCLPGREWLQLDATPLTWFYELDEDRFDSDDPNLVRLSYRELIALNAIIPKMEVTIEQKPSRDAFLRLLDTEAWTDVSTLPMVPEHLRSYQRNGFAWLNRLHTLGIGGILADDMGLGKTHQGLALLLAAARENKKTTTLVICPASVVFNWADKIEQFFKGLDYIVYYGPNRKAKAAGKRNLILTTYGTMRQDWKHFQKVSFDVILLDEIQNIKNRATATHKAVASLTGRVKIGLTGTPIENSLQDLRSLFDICLPGFLGSERQFENQYVRPIMESNNTKVRKRLGRLINPFILRRTRGQVLTELPEIIEDNRTCKLSDDQVALYRETLENSDSFSLEEQGDDGPSESYINILATITRLKQICCHPCLVQGCTSPQEYNSGKWDLFLELSQELLDSNLKFVVFSQYAKMIDLMEAHFQETGIHYKTLTGEMVAGKRQKMIEEFNNDPKCQVFCASLLAGGTGIDLTSANAVIHYDRWWNPAKEEQATARVHRMGQKSVVQVFRLITYGTLEEKIHRLISKKQQLSSDLIQEDEAGIIKQMDRKQLMELFRYTAN